jgi:hypothetical protein
LATIHLGGGRRIVVCNTHLNGGGPNSEAARRRQIFNITKSLREYINEQNTLKLPPGGQPLLPIQTAFQIGDYNIGPMTKEGLPDKEWASHLDYFTRYNYHYILPAERPQGTTFDFNVKGVGWSMSQLDQWKLTNERVDQILAHVGGALTPAQQAAASAAPTAGAGAGAGAGSSVAVTVGTGLSLQVPYGELMIDRMVGSSDHAALRGTFTWGLRQPPPLQGDGQPVAAPIDTQWVDPNSIPLPSANIGYGAGGGFAPPAHVTIHT